MLKSTMNSAAESYDALSANFQHKEFLDFVSPLKIEPGFKCLDIGCGTGSNTACLAQIVGKDGHALGIDPDEQRIKLASEKYKDRSNLEFVIGRSVDIPLCNEGYDLIVSNHAMHWVNHDETIETYRKAFNAIKPGGIIAILETSGLTRTQKAYLPNCSEEMQEKVLSLAHFTSLEENRKIFTDIGFKIIEVEEFVLKSDFESIDLYLKFLDANMNGVVNGKEIYERNINTFDALLNDDGSMTEELTNTRIIATKSVQNDII